MHTRFLLGPAGSGRTFRCLAEIRAALAAAPGGPPLLLLAPKQTTYQLERQLLADPSLPGYARLHILSFERLALFLFDWLQKAPPRMLDEEGRLMVLRALLAKKRDDLKLFRASARLTGFAQHLSLVLRELQRHQLTPESLAKLAEEVSGVEGLSAKLHDLATLLGTYLEWLRARQLQDADCLLDNATEILRAPQTPLALGGVWVDGFAEFSPQEMDLLAEIVSRSPATTITFCLDRVPTEKISWLSTWSVVRRTYQQCRERLAGLPHNQLVTELLPRRPDQGRFIGNPVLRHLEAHWAEPRPYGAAVEPIDHENQDALSSPSPREERAGRGATLTRKHWPSPPSAGGEGQEQPSTSPIRASLCIASCTNAEAEATLAAREILRFARSGGRFREVTVLARDLKNYHEALVNVFTRYEIPFFLDRRESVSHHPLAELSRNALRTVAFSWARDDWFAALKTGLTPASEAEIDRLENEALERGWKGRTWHQPILIPDEPELTRELEAVRAKVIPVFLKLAVALGNKPTGSQLAAALRDFWQTLDVAGTLQKWSEQPGAPHPIHATVWEQMNAWVDNVERAFDAEPLPLREWLPILEAGLAGLTVGVIPPALDQVSIGAIDRSRNPDIRLALVLGMNETVFPAPPQPSVLLTETDRAELEKQGIALSTARRQLGQERYFGYVACTRARQRLVLTYAAADANGKPLNPSPFLSQFKQLFPALEFEIFPRTLDWRRSEHTTELIVPMLRDVAAGVPPGGLKPRHFNTPESSDTDPGGKMPPSTAGETPAAASNARALPSFSPAGGEGARRADEGADEQFQKRNASNPGLSQLYDLPALVSLRAQLRHLITPSGVETLAPQLAQRLYGPALRTSVSRMEQFAACPFKFFVHSGLRAEERKLFELDIRDQGNFQHEVLAEFHEQLRAENKRWRDVTPAGARERIKTLAVSRMVSFRDGLLQASEEGRFTARMMTESLQDFVETLVGWMQRQYAFDPARVELPFGDSDGIFPPWDLDIGEGHHLLLHGRIDRIDIFPNATGDEALCVVVDYKSSQKQLDSLLMEHGLQLQLPAYLNVLRHWPNPKPLFGVNRLIPAGVFYVNLRGKYERGENRDEALADVDSARKLAYRHSGRFDSKTLKKLDQRTEITAGDQFNYRLKKDGEIAGNSNESMPSDDFLALLDVVESALKNMGKSIYAGVAQVDPYRKGATTACEQCDYRAICRIDPWTHSYRVLRKTEKEEA